MKRVLSLLPWPWLLATAASAEIRIERVDARIDDVIAPGVTAEALATGVRWAEGPVWDVRTGSLFFSDVIANVLYRWGGASRSSRRRATPARRRSPGASRAATGSRSTVRAG